MFTFKRWFMVIIGAAVVALGTGATRAQETPKFGTVTGTVGYIQKIALANSAEVLVELVDVTAGTSPNAQALASQRIIANGRQVPFGYALNYEVASIDPAGRYAMRATIFIDGAARWLTTGDYPVITNGKFSADVLVTQSSSAQSNLAGTQWKLVSYGPPTAQTPALAGSTLEFRTDANTVMGSGGCNQFSGSYTVTGSTIKFGALLSTLMACADDKMNTQEQKYFVLLGGATRYEISGEQLKIEYKEGSLIFVRVGAAPATQQP